MIEAFPQFLDSDSLELLQRAFEGACWTLGVRPLACATDTVADLAARETIAHAILVAAQVRFGTAATLKADGLRALNAIRRLQIGPR
jgi:hypothetical protein